MKFRDDEDSERLIETTQRAETFLVGGPVHTNNRLRRDDFGVEQLY